MITDWNEIEFMNWEAFQAMAPPLIDLEVRRLGRLIAKPNLDTELHNTLVRSRYRLRQLSAAIRQANQRPDELDLVSPLSEAILGLTAVKELCDGQIARTIEYVVDHLNAILTRARLLY